MSQEEPRTQMTNAMADAQKASYDGMIAKNAESAAKSKLRLLRKLYPAVAADLVEEYPEFKYELTGEKPPKKGETPAT